MPMPLPPPDFHFQLSPGLQRTLSSSPSARGRARSRAEVDNIVNMVYEECDAFAEQQKVHVRNDMKKQLLELNGLCPQLKQTYRSRREARVSRVKSDEFQKAIKKCGSSPDRLYVRVCALRVLRHRCSVRWRWRGHTPIT
eukprot:IDg16097t1